MVQYKKILEALKSATIKYEYLKSGKLATPVLTTAPSEFEIFKLQMMAVGNALIHLNLSS